VALIAITSGGDQAVVNRLAHRMFAEPGAGVAGAETAAPRASWRQRAAIFVCLGILCAIVGAVGSRELGGLVGNHVLPQKDDIVPATGVTARVAPPDPSPIAAGSSPSGSERPAAAPPSLPAPEPTGLRLSADEVIASWRAVMAFLPSGISPRLGCSSSVPPMPATAVRRCAWH
jgi:hypothetical protein